MFNKKVFFMWLWRAFDFVLIPFLILFFSYDPLFMHGHIVPQDEGQHLAWINSLLHRRIPYRDIYMFYGPLLEYIPAFLMKLFGSSIVVLRAFYHFGMISGLILSYFLGRLVIKNRFLLYVMPIALVSTRISPFWSSRWGGPRLVMGIVAIICLIISQKNNKSTWFYLSGFCASVAFLVSQEVGLCLFFSSSIFIWAYNKLPNNSEPNNNLRNIFVYSLGVSTLMIPFLLGLILKKAIKDYFIVSFFDLPFRFSRVFLDPHPLFILFNRDLSVIGKAVLFSKVIIFFLSISILTYGIYLVINSLLRKKFYFDHLNIMLFCVFGGSLLVLSTRRLEGMQFNMSAPPIIILGFILIERFIIGDVKVLFQSIVDIFRFKTSKLDVNSLGIDGHDSEYVNLLLIKTELFFKKISKILPPFKLFIMLCLLALFFRFLYVYVNPGKIIPAVFYKINNFHKVTGLGLTHEWDLYITTEEWLARDTGWDLLDLDRTKGVYVPIEQTKITTAVVNYLKLRLYPGENILVFPHEGQYYFLLDKVGPTRFDSLIYAAINPEYQKEVIQDLEQDKTRYIIYVKDSYVFTDFKKIPNEERLNLIDDYIKNNYFEKVSFGETYILKRKI
jgi:hypothetical protein